MPEGKCKIKKFEWRGDTYWALFTPFGGMPLLFTSFASTVQYMKLLQESIDAGNGN